MVFTVFGTLLVRKGSSSWAPGSAGLPEVSQDRFWSRFWIDVGTILDPPGSSKIVLPSRRQCNFLTISSPISCSFPGGLLGAILEPPGTPPEAPRSAPGAPGETQERPRRAERSPRRRKMEDPDQPQEASGSDFRSSRGLREAIFESSGASRERFRTDLGVLLGPPGT